VDRCPSRYRRFLRSARRAAHLAAVALAALGLLATTPTAARAEAGRACATDASRLCRGTQGRQELLACLQHLLKTAGNASLMTTELMKTVCDHSAGNHRIMTTMASELLAAAAQKERTQLDEKLYLEVFEAPRKRAAGGRRR